MQIFDEETETQQEQKKCGRKEGKKGNITERYSFTKAMTIASSAFQFFHGHRQKKKKEDRGENRFEVERKS